MWLTYHDKRLTTMQRKPRRSWTNHGQRLSYKYFVVQRHYLMDAVSAHLRGVGASVIAVMAAHVFHVSGAWLLIAFVIM